MKILVVSQYFWPENFRINDLVTALKDRGHEITVLTGVPNYPDGEIFSEYVESPNTFANFFGVEVIRVPMLPRKKGGLRLLMNYISFALSATLYGVKKTKSREFDVILACQLSPITSVLPAIAIKAKKNIPLAMWSLDLWPDSLKAVGIVRSQIVIDVVGKLVSFIYGKCDLILAQSEEYLSAIRERDPTDTSMAVFPNWAEELFSFERKAKNNTTFNILFAGNVGEAQDFDAIVECAKLIKVRHLPVQLNIVGEGRRLRQLEREIHCFDLKDVIILHGKHPLEKMPEFYSQADAALVSLKRNEVFSRTVPGKVQSYMFASLPILGMIDGATSQLIEDAKCGYVCDSGSYRSLFENIVRFVNSSESERMSLGRNGYEYASINFNKKNIVDKLENQLNKLINNHLMKS
ncbi:glycosyltransferase family 4 protein [Vibrio fluvialis]|uniref:glycosyltransferase family 4 protein n=1 Tax=Vibrio fluvialis TaxID=676 RepID=UPI00192B7DAE|nr:glycosyltransferase family 4 protein [Vibrio fluvialis]MBL4287585.1 glycosyltransferase family 4 protein [Vibrio fluvialis]MBL4291596.1 glycosyltransferase family 4 protein [Vibrio fluvialis]MBY7770909.1 glycosyltransferase family 4 protein [Vibrio fluvialis]MBY8044770.1 glycosyltransferase family 4 protein [Vibrio fluvialis]MBY8053340.1 glycosyltransferase family 4 protein [Vibrio fluvialis]